MVSREAGWAGAALESPLPGARVAVARQFARDVTVFCDGRRERTIGLHHNAHAVAFACMGSSNATFLVTAEGHQVSAHPLHSALKALSSRILKQS